MRSMVALRQRLQPASLQATMTVHELLAAEQPDANKAEEEIRARLLHLHKAAGHCSNRSLARILRDAG